MQEAWAQMKQSPGKLKHFKTSNGLTLNDVHYSSYNIWHSFAYNHETRTFDTYEPKFSNNVGTHRLCPRTHQPEQISNLVHANAYTQTDMVHDLMESAIEAGTRAANYIHSGVAEPDEERFRHPGWFWGVCQCIDNVLFKIGLPNFFEILLNWI